jgi:hypothetical protein
VFLQCRLRLASILVPPRGTLAGLQIEFDPDGPHTLGWVGPKDRMRALHDLFMERILAGPKGGAA